MRDRACCWRAPILLLAAVCVSSSTAISWSEVSVPDESSRDNVTIESWLTYFHGEAVQLTTESQSSLVLGRPWATARENIAARKPARLRRGRYLLSPVLPFLINEKDGEAFVELGEPDSFLDLIDLDTGDIYRLVSIGPSGFILDVTWLSDDVFAVLCVTELEGSNRSYSIMIFEFDLESMVRLIRAPSDRKSFSEEKVYRFVIEEGIAKKESDSEKTLQGDNQEKGE